MTGRNKTSSLREEIAFSFLGLKRVLERTFLATINLQHRTSSQHTKMFSMLPRLRDTHNQSHHYTPHVPSPLSSSPLRSSPSPLSPRDANVPPRVPDTLMSSPPKQSTMRSESDENSITPSSNKSALISPPPTRRESSFSKRTTKVNPLIHGRGNADEGRETRRKLFLKNVREASEEKRWRDRGGDDEIMRCIWVAEQRRLDERRRKEVMGFEADVEEEEPSIDEVMADEVAMKEEQELEALLGYLNQDDGNQIMNQSMVSEPETNALMWDNINNRDPTNPAPQGQLTAETPYGSDDEEYDDIFMDVIQEETRLSSQRQPSGYSEDQDMMDMS
ncbi:hypothetical protein EG329_012174 [Mollisiaceae sp. DMI_Dod_QoI]|nr:hypothetical protein EG329_012174 [Helotiales sp. DMI_Dod_QoI]